MVDPMADPMVDVADVAAASALVQEVLGPEHESPRWDEPAGDLDWTCRRTVDHLSDALLYYASNVAGRGERRSALRDGEPGAGPRRLLRVAGCSAEVLGALLATMGPGDRAWHPAGVADRSGYAAMAADELLVHGWDVATGLGVPFPADPALAGRVVARLFPWVEGGDDPWAALLWANGRVARGERARLDPGWYWWCRPLDEWDGEPARRTAPPRW